MGIDRVTQLILALDIPSYVETAGQRGLRMQRVLHSVFGMGSVVATSGAGETAKADVDFGSAGVKRLSLRHAPLEKL